MFEFNNRGNYPLSQLKESGALKLALTKVIPLHLNTIVLYSNEFEINDNKLSFSICFDNNLDFTRFKLGFSIDDQPVLGNSMTFDIQK